MPPKKDLSGQVFGRLLVLCEDHKDARGRLYWECQCECGQYTIVRGDQLVSGRTTSCGCKSLLNLIGRRFGRLLVVGRSSVRLQYGVRFWECLCDCGGVVHIKSADLLSGNTRSCGCLFHDMLVARNISHGLAQSPLYNIWFAMIARCYNPNVKKYYNYGGRGIKVCDRWLGEYGLENFINDMGPRPSKKHSLDRIDNDGDYCPENCRWATIRQQQNNRRITVVIEFNGERRSLVEWAEALNITYMTLYSRIYKMHWSIEKTLTTPVDPIAGRFKPKLP